MAFNEDEEDTSPRATESSFYNIFVRMRIRLERVAIAIERAEERLRNPLGFRWVGTRNQIEKDLQDIVLEAEEALKLLGSTKYRHVNNPRLPPRPPSHS